MDILEFSQQRQSKILDKQINGKRANNEEEVKAQPAVRMPYAVNMA